MNLAQRLVWPLVPVHQALQRRLHELDYLFLEITQRCDLRCRHCGSDCRRDTTTPDLTREVIRDVLADVRRNLRPKQLTVVLSGGEPRCHPDLFAIGRDITALGYPWGLVTNGWNWDRRAVQEAAAAGMRTATVSLDGLADTHDWLRGREGSFDRASATISLLNEHGGWDATDVVTCVHRRNLHQLPAVHDHLQRLGVTRWRLFTISPIGRATADPDLHLDAAQYAELLSAIAQLRATSSLTVALSESGYLGPRHELTVRDQPSFCRAGITVGGVMADGTILACPNIDRSLGQGNVHRDSFSEVWNGGFARFRDRRWMRTGICEDCRHWRHCQGGPMHLRRASGDGPALCHVEAYWLDQRR